MKEPRKKFKSVRIFSSSFISVLFFIFLLSISSGINKNTKRNTYISLTDWRFPKDGGMVPSIWLESRKLVESENILCFNFFFRWSFLHYFSSYFISFFQEVSWSPRVNTRILNERVFQVQVGWFLSIDCGVDS